MAEGSHVRLATALDDAETLAPLVELDVPPESVLEVLQKRVVADSRPDVVVLAVQLSTLEPDGGPQTETIRHRRHRVRQARLVKDEGEPPQ